MLSKVTITVLIIALLAKLSGSATAISILLHTAGFIFMAVMVAIILYEIIKTVIYSLYCFIYYSVVATIIVSTIFALM